MRTKAAAFTISASSSIGSTYRIGRFKYNDVIRSIKCWHADAGASGDVDVGLYDTPSAGGAVVDANAYATAWTLDAAAALLIPDELRFKREWAAAVVVATLTQAVWEDGGVTTNPGPGTQYDLAFTVTNAFPATPTLIAVQFEYTSGD
jgi:hypothetical protein